jgi:hypothetical protein
MRRSQSDAGRRSRRWLLGAGLAGAGCLWLGCEAPLAPKPAREDGSAAGRVTRALVAPPSPSRFVAADNAAAAWLASQQDLSGTGLVDSFEDFSAPDTPILLSYTYDQAVAAIAFAVRGDAERARAVLDRLQSIQGDDGSWVNSYWAKSLAGEELRKHVGPVVWVAMAVMSYEVLNNGDVAYHAMATRALDWALQFTQANGALAGGRTTWASGDGTWTDEPWSSTEHNLDAYAALQYFAGTTPEKASAYQAAAAGVRRFLDSVVWDGVRHRFWGGFSAGAVDGKVPLDVNPWSVLALGPDYASTLTYVETANADPGTDPDHPRYVAALPFEGATINLYDFDWESDGKEADPRAGGGMLGPDIWFEGSAFMSEAHAAVGNADKAEAIIAEITRKQGASGSKEGGVPYSLLGTNNQYWKMSQQNCVSSTGWLILAIHRWNPFTASAVGDGSADAGVSDAEVSDAEVSDAEVSDAEVSDAEVSDAGVSDAEASDARATDAEAFDAGADSGSPSADAGASDGRVADAGGDRLPISGGCGCSASDAGVASFAWLFAVALGFRRRGQGAVQK